jgi:serine/threonine protein phosphatase PrpC
MKLTDSAGKTHPGRKRRHNEDTFVIEPPLFAVADGMGGAQAGEVASRMAAAAFREYHDADELAPAERVQAIIQEANRRIYDRAQSDTGSSGMGTTVTAALVESGQVAIGHVGDSRAYRLRDGRLEQLTEDHSLVADLMRTGRLTPEEAEAHPQRSVITRALGTDSEVDVDIQTLDPLPGDVFLLCSDGLTTMVSNERIVELVERSSSLDQAAKALVKAANRGGGEDNITVVLFAVEDEAAGLEETLVRGDGRGRDEDLEDTLAGLEVPPQLQQATTGRRGRRWPRRLLVVLAAVAAVVALIAGALWGFSRAYFVGADDEGNVTVYQGVPFDFTDDVGLYRERYVSRLQASQLSPEERQELFDHELISYDDALARVRRYEEQGLP